VQARPVQVPPQRFARTRRDIHFAIRLARLVSDSAAETASRRIGIFPWRSETWQVPLKFD
jgi:hypothetical protein